MAAGTQTNADPPTGSSDTSAVAIPRKTGNGTPKAQYPNPPSAPCARTVRRVPWTTAETAV